MKKNMRFIVLLVVLGCSSGKKETLTLDQLINTADISSVIMHNYSGTFALSPDQLVRFKAEIGTALYLPNQSYKLGAIAFTMEIGDNTVYVSSNSGSSLLEISESAFETKKNLGNSSQNDYYFSTSGINYQNYQPPK